MFIMVTLAGVTDRQIINTDHVQRVVEESVGTYAMIIMSGENGFRLPVEEGLDEILKMIKPTVSIQPPENLEEHA